MTLQLPAFSLLETLLWTPEEGLFLLDRHLDRLQRTACYFSRPLDREAIHGVLVTATEALPPVRHKARLTVPSGGAPRVVVQPLSLAGGRYRIGLAKRPVDPSNPFLYHKTTHRTIYEQARQSSPGYDDVLLWNAQGEVTESCIANVLIERGGRWFTPPVNCGLLAGTYRSWLLEQGKIEERVFRVDDLKYDARIGLINSVRQAWQGCLVWQAEAGTARQAEALMAMGELVKSR